MNRTIMLLALAVGWSALGTTARSADEPRGRNDDKAVRRDAPRGDEVVRPERGRPAREESDRVQRPERNERPERTDRPERPQAGPRDGDRDINAPPPFARNREGGPAAVCPHCKRELGAGVRGPQSERGIRPWGQARGDQAGNRQWGPPADGSRPEMGPMARRDGDRQFDRGGDRPSGPMRPGFRPPMGGPEQGQRGFGLRPKDRQAGPGSRMGRPGLNRGPQMQGPRPFGQERRFGPPVQGNRPQMGPMNRRGGDRPFGPPSMQGPVPFGQDRRMGPPMQGGRPPMMGPMGPQARGQAFGPPGAGRSIGPAPFAQRSGRGPQDRSGPDRMGPGRPERPMGPPQGDQGPDRRGPPGRPDFN